ncbi:uncharacterized protein LOC133827725 [Humulus lupulus]|uniref:uncharacterized protein LOC133827725 n=1 Tax=Humulus lupulus TaxID=3486 RepID=UPI002B405474|nr:uncharacterized protein LOC133827725 [Humulus lupulus]
MPSAQLAALAAPSVDLATEVARLREQLRLRDEELAHARQASHMPQKQQAPPTFEGKADPMVAEDWLRSFEAIFDHLELNDHQRVSCAVYLLKMDARIWWDVMKQTRDLNTMTWAEFVQAFSKKYYNLVVLATKVDDFVTLVQGNLSDTDYAQKFDRLTKFTPEVVPTKTL